VKPVVGVVVAVLAGFVPVLSADAPASAAPAGVVRSVGRSPSPPPLLHRPPRPRRPHPKRAPWPITVTIQTVPPLAGVHVRFDGTELVTDAAGRTAYTAEHNFNQHTVALVDTAIDLSDRHYRFARWAGQRDPGQAFRSSVGGLPMRANYTVTAAFTVQYPVTARFLDEQGRPVETDRISSVQIKSDTGQLLDFPKNGTIWLDGTLPSYRKSELVETDVSYSLQSLVVGGTNIVDAGRQKFLPAKTSTVTFTGEFFDLTLHAHDAMFGGFAGRQAKVTYPDGRALLVPLGPNGNATLAGLPRGRYKVTVSGASGVVLADEFVLSRDKALDLAVVSIVDAATIGLVLLLLAVGLLLVGRARVRRYLGGRLGRLAYRTDARLRSVQLAQLAIGLAAGIPARIPVRIPARRRDHPAPPLQLSIARTPVALREATGSELEMPIVRAPEAVDDQPDPAIAPESSRPMSGVVPGSDASDRKPPV